jgi:hypothetical protein
MASTMYRKKIERSHVVSASAYSQFCSNWPFVTRLVEIVERIGELDRPVLLAADEEVLQLGADLELVAQRLGALELTAEDRARVVEPRLAVDVQVAGEAGDLGPPGQRREGARVRDRGEVVVVGLLAHRAGRVSGEAGAVFEQAVEVAGRHELGARLAVHVHELREQELDPVRADPLACLVGRGR